jgi:DNA mismatch endonuclease (patch repair protein)
MVDRISEEKRSWNMSRIRSTNTQPEMVVRSFLHRKGFRFRLHQKNVFGKPDIILKKYKTAIFIDGCFWHRHKDCRFAYTPKSTHNPTNNKPRYLAGLLLKSFGWGLLSRGVSFCSK